MTGVDDGGWAVTLPTVAETRVRLAAPAVGPGEPWPLSRALARLGPVGVRATDRFRALGSGRGAPLIHSQEAAWRGMPMELEAISSRDPAAMVEVSLALPCHAELTAAGTAGEDDLWELVDALAVAIDAQHGAIVDGEAMVLDQPDQPGAWAERFRRHCGLLVPEAAAAGWPAAANPYRRLPLSGLVVVLR